jgi:hypothetical protein
MNRFFTQQQALLDELLPLNITHTLQVCLLNNQVLQFLLQKSLELPSEIHYYTRLQQHTPSLLYYSLMTFHILLPAKTRFLRLKLKHLYSVYDALAHCIGFLMFDDLAQKAHKLLLLSPLSLDQKQAQLDLLTHASLLKIHKVLSSFIDFFNLDDPSQPFKLQDISQISSSLQLLHSQELLRLNLPLTFTKIRQNYYKPNRWVRSWIPLVLGSIGTYALVSRASLLYKSLTFTLTEFNRTLFEFFKGWILEPCFKIYETVRYRESKLRIMGASTLTSDLNSLERMVLDFAKDAGKLSPDTDISMLSEQIRSGDLTLVLESYEQDMKTPVQSVFTGKLIRPLLIQIQKAKVDAALALSALDSLLRSNELNFSLMALLPVLAITGISIRWLMIRLRSLRGITQRSSVKGIKSSLREIERILNQYPHTSTAITFETRGYLLMQIVYLNRLGMYLRRVHQFAYQQDVKELERLFEDEWTIAQVYKRCIKSLGIRNV